MRERPGTAEHRLGSRIKASVASLATTFRSSEPLDLLVGRRRVVDDREGFQIPLIGGSGDAFELVEVRDAFIHGTPHHVAVARFAPAVCGRETHADC